MRGVVFLVSMLAVLTGRHVGATSAMVKEYEAMVRSLRSGSMRPDPATGSRVAAMGNSHNAHPEEMGSYMEGDIMLSSPDVRADKNIHIRWPQGVVPYVISDKFDPDTKLTIKKAMEAFDKYTCVRFVPRTSQKDYVQIMKNDTGCWSFLGKLGGPQLLNIQVPGCNHIGIVMHELMHALGILHEQSRADRDQFVRINTENIEPGKEDQFTKNKKYMGLGTNYDYDSAMHYSMTAFSKNTASKQYRTIVPVICQNNNFDAICDNLLTNKLGQRYGFSHMDVQKIRTLYEC